MRASKKTGIPAELALVETIRRRAARSARGLRGLGIGDDCAILRPARGHEICVTTDLSLEDVHFRRDWHPPESVGHRCLARGLSDLAAVGAEPLAVFLSLALPARLPAAWLDRFFQGFLALAEKYRVALAGGDTAQSPDRIAADVVALGQVPRARALLRSGAHAGDAVYVTGALGGAAAELRALAENPKRFRSLRQPESGHPHLFPEPRLAVGRRLRGAATAAIDISDGLSTDLMHLCRESHLTAVIEEAALPVHPLAAQRKEALELALHGGEEYELLFTAPSTVRIPKTIAGIPVRQIGALRAPARSRPTLLLKARDGSERPIAPRGWEHFSRSE